MEAASRGGETSRGLAVSEAAGGMVMWIDGVGRQKAMKREQDPRTRFLARLLCADRTEQQSSLRRGGNRAARPRILRPPRCNRLGR